MGCANVLFKAYSQWAHFLPLGPHLLTLLPPPSNHRQVTIPLTFRPSGDIQDPSYSSHPVGIFLIFWINIIYISYRSHWCDQNCVTDVTGALKEERVSLVHSLMEHSVTVGRAWQTPGARGAGHILSMVTKQKELNSDTLSSAHFLCFPFFFFFASLISQCVG